MPYLHSSFKLSFPFSGNDTFFFHSRRMTNFVFTLFFCFESTSLVNPKAFIWCIWCEVRTYLDIFPQTGS